VIAHWCFEHGNEECDCLVNFMQMFIDAKDSHTDADLAMALELVPHLELDWHLSGKTNGNKHVIAWLLWQVRNALLERAE